MNRIVFVLLWIFSLVVMPCRAIMPGYVDTTHCTVKKFDEKQISDYRSQKAFRYETAHARDEGIFALIAYLIAGFFDKLSDTHVGDVSLYDVLFYSLAVIAALLIIYHFFKAEITGLFAGNQQAIVSAHQSYSENVHELDFNTLIQNALANTDYRLATRLYYLNTLKRLSDSGLINWQKNKTNFDYYYELKGEDRRRQFYNLTGIFESVWYGNFEISAADFDENLKAFNGFLQTIKP